jgi:hypothetical protein
VGDGGTSAAYLLRRLASLTMRVPLQRPQVAEASPPTRARQRVSRPRGCQIPERRTRVLGLRGRAGGPDARELHPQKSAFGLIRSQPKAVLKGVRGKGKAQGRRKPLERELMAPLGPARNPWRLSYATCTGHIRDTFLAASDAFLHWEEGEPEPLI